MVKANSKFFLILPNIIESLETLFNSVVCSIFLKASKYTRYWGPSAAFYLDTAQLTHETINKMGWEVQPVPTFSPDLALSDFLLFGPLKEALLGNKFQDNKDIKKFVGIWLNR